MYGRKEVFCRSKYLRKNECTNLWKEICSEQMEILMEGNLRGGNEEQKETIVEERMYSGMFRRRRTEEKGIRGTR